MKFRSYWDALAYVVLTPILFPLKVCAFGVFYLAAKWASKEKLLPRCRLHGWKFCPSCTRPEGYDNVQ